jgi:hypothetical protein
MNRISNDIKKVLNDKFEWDLGTPLMYAFKYEGNPQNSESVFRHLKLPVYKKNQVHFFPAYQNYKPLTKYPFLLEPLKGRSVLSFLKAIDKGLGQKIQPTSHDQMQVAYALIGTYKYPEDRFKFVRDVERGELTWRQIIGAHPHFTGHLRNNESNIWTFSTET